MSQLRVTGNAIISGAGQSLQLTSASDVYLNITRGASILNIGIDATGSFYNTSTSHRFFTNSGTITALTIASSGAATFISSVTATQGIFSNVSSITNADQSGARLVISNTGSGGQAVNLVAGNPNVDQTGFSIAYGNTNFLRFNSTGAATFLSSVDATQFSSIGRGTSFGYKLPDWQIYNTTSGNRLTFSNYSADLLTITSGGNVLIGTTTDSGEKLQVNGITKTNGLSLGATTFSSNTTMTSDYYFWEFTGGAGVTLTLYSSSGNNNTHFIKNGSGVSLTISGTIYTLSSGAPTSSITLAAYKTIQLISRGGGSWYIMYQTT